MNAIVITKYRKIEISFLKSDAVHSMIMKTCYNFNENFYPSTTIKIHIKNQIVAKDYNSAQQSETHFSCDMQRKKPITTFLFAQIFFIEKRGGLILKRVRVRVRTHARTQNWPDI